MNLILFVKNIEIDIKICISKVSLLCEEYKLKGPKMLEKYQLGKITAEEFENWIDGMKIRKS